MSHTEGEVFAEAATRAVTQSAREAPRELTPTDRRRHTRFACPTEASARLQPGISVRVLDLGLGGVFVESSTRLVPGSVTTVAFDAPDVAVRVRARIKRVSVSGFERVVGGEASPLYRAGLEFGLLSRSEVCAVEAFVSGVARATGGGSADGCPAELDRAVSRLHLPLVTEAPTSPTLVTAATSAPGVEPAPTAVQPDRPVFIRFPLGWAVTTRMCAVVARAPEERGYVFLGAPPRPPSRDLREFARASMYEAGFSVLHCQPAEINRLAGCIGFYTGRLHDVGTVIIEAAHVVLSNQTYLIAGVAPWATYETVRHEFFATINSFGGQPAADGACLVAAPPSGPSAWLDLGIFALGSS
jgi:PilZ domain